MTAALVLLFCVIPMALVFILGLCRAAADTRTVDDGRGFGGDE